MTQLAQANDPNYDPRQELIPTAPDIDGNLPSGEVTTPNAGGSLIEVLGNIFGDFWTWILAAGGLASILGTIWSVYTVLAYLFCLFCIGLYIYATIKLGEYSGLITQRIRDEEKRWNQANRGQDRPSRLDDMLAHVQSENPNDWKLAIIEADVILDQTLIERGYVGGTLGERLKNITPTQLGSIQDAWDAHIVRNQIAHQGADFILTKRLTEETIAKYRRVFTELGVD